jgi:prepilin signal peptidase PulO-like enzyme (type II secretory pathway)
MGVEQHVSAIILAGVFAACAFGIWNKRKFGLWIGVLSLLASVLWALSALVLHPRESGLPLAQFIYLAFQIPYFWKRRHEFT